MFKNYLEVNSEEKGRQIETKSKLDKQLTQMKFKGYQKEFEHNAQIDSVFDRIRSANVSQSKEVDDLGRVFYSQFWNENGQNVKCSRFSIPHSYSGMDRMPFHPFRSQAQNEQTAANAFRTNHSYSRMVDKKTRPKLRKGDIITDQQLFRGEITFFMDFVFIANFVLSVFCYFPMWGVPWETSVTL